MSASATMNARACPALGARRTNAVRGAGRKVVTATSRRVAAVTSAEYKVRSRPAVDPRQPHLSHRPQPLAVRSSWRAGTTSRASPRLRFRPLPPVPRSDRGSSAIREKRSAPIGGFWLFPKSDHAPLARQTLTSARSRSHANSHRSRSSAPRAASASPCPCS